MCGRFNLTRPAEVIERFGFLDWTEKRIEPRFNIAPSQEILTIVQQPLGPPFAQTATWGLKPFWLPTGKPPPINARAETVSGRFRDARRCLIPATGFYEWRNRQPMHIQLKGGGVFAFAGLWLPGTHGGPPSAAIITTRPNELMASIHTRMPAILHAEDERAWIDPTEPDPQRLLGPLEAELMDAYPVAALVNAWENDGPELIAPAAELPVAFTLELPLSEPAPTARTPRRRA